MKELKHLFFDLDGTLIDSGDGIITCLKHTFDKFDIDYSNFNFNQFIGPPLESTIEDIISNDEKIISEAVSVFRKKYTEIGVLEENNLYDGALKMIESLYNAGFELNLATSKPEVYAVKIVGNLGIAKYFKHVVGSLFDSRREKDKVLAHALSISGADKSKSAMIGDRKYDLLAAEKYGVHGIGVLYGFGELDELQKCKYIYLAKTPLDLLDYIKPTKIQKGEI